MPSRRAFLLSGGAALTGAVAGCLDDENGEDLETVDQHYSYSEPEGRGTWRVDVKNTGEGTNVLATVDLVSTTGDGEGEVIESYDRTGIIEAGEEETISVTNAHYRNTHEYDFSRGIERTERPHAAFEISDDDGEITLDASQSTSVDSSIVSYEWTATEFDWVGDGDPLGWDIPDGEVTEFTHQIQMTTLRRLF